MIRRPPRSTLFPYRRSSDLQGEAVGSCGATLEVFIEVLRPEPRLIIAGAGYVAQALARLAARLDFRIRSEEHTSELQSLTNLVCRLLLEKKKIRMMILISHI